ncbi:hypothetical protein M1403_04065 [Patescibacteria group bacterium]|nr:hypothetical protein [Patescibacteria group bacterium]
MTLYWQNCLHKGHMCSWNCKEGEPCKIDEIVGRPHSPREPLTTGEWVKCINIAANPGRSRNNPDRHRFYPAKLLRTYTPR